LIIRENTDLTREQAEELYRENKAINESNQPVMQPFQQPGEADAVQEQEEE